jgi:hypothetical protein
MTVSFLKPGVSPDAVRKSPLYIPRVLWQTVRDRNNLTPEIQACATALRTTNPTWDYRIFDDRSQLEFLEAVCSDRFMRAYRRIAPEYGAARADLFRYVVIFLHGGAYFDSKSGTSRPLDEILRDDDEFILSQWDNGPDGKFPGSGLGKPLTDIEGGEYEQWVIIARPGHPYLSAVLEQVLENIETFSPYRFGHGAKGVLNLCGPHAYTRTIHRNLGRARHRKVVSWPEGIRYTMLGDVNAHKLLDTSHYARSISAPVTDHGLKGWQRVRYWLLEGSYWPFSRLRWLNHRRLLRRKIRNKGKL